MIPASDLKRLGFTRKDLPVLFPEPGEKFPLRTYDLRLRDGSTRSFRVRSLNDVFSLLEEEAWPDGWRHGPFPEGLRIAAISVDGEWRLIRPGLLFYPPEVLRG